MKIAAATPEDMGATLPHQILRTSSRGAGITGLNPDPLEEAPQTERAFRSDLRYSGDPRQIEFMAVPDDLRIEGAAAALNEVASVATGIGAQDGEMLRVCLTTVRLPPGLPFNLFGFHLVSVGEDGSVSDGADSAHEIVYALVLNQPVAIIRETATRFLLNLVSRQAPIGQVLNHRREIRDLPRLVAQSDATNADLAWDLPPESVQVIDAVDTAAAEAGVRLEVRFQLDPFPAARSVARRIPALRALYNDHDVVRAAIDKTVSTAGTDRGSFRGGPEDIRAFTQRTATLEGWRLYFNQVVRDAQVCGNGYLVTDMSGLNPAMRCLRPELANIEHENKFVGHGADRYDADRVLHLKGLEQSSSPYGISVLEPLLYLKARADMAEELNGMARSLPIANLTEDQRRQLEAHQRLFRQMLQEAESRVETLLSFFDALEEPATQLYFPGQDRMR